MADNQITCYPTYGFKDSDGTWKISMRVLVYESRALESVLERLLEPVVVEVAKHFSDHEIDRHIAGTIFKERIAYFLREGVDKKEVVFKFHDNTKTNSYTVDGLTTGKDGLITADITLDPRKASWLAGEGDQSLTYQASVSGGGPVGEGRVQLLGAEGVSVISDIDDTIKITEIPAGSEVVALNTFFRPFASVEQPDNMLSMYQGSIRTPGGFTLSPGVSFHYVSGGPWQLYELLAAYLIDERHFPAGSFHLRTVDLGQSAIGQGMRLVALVEKAFNLAQQPQPDQIQQNDTYIHKIDVIQKLMTAMPGRKFLMFGDSGEFDPEVYEAILSQPKFSKMVKETNIREVKNIAPNDPRRLKMRSVNMFVRDAAPIVHGKSQFDASGQGST
jgi:phosphatidate phosphatase APP1